MTAIPQTVYQSMHRWELKIARRELTTLRELKMREHVNLLLAETSLLGRARDALHLLNGMAGEW
jgi:hypothetical protein